MTRMGWDYENRAVGFPVYFKIVLPEKRLMITIGSREHTINDVLKIIRNLIYNDLPMEFSLNEDKTSKYQPWSN